MQTAASERDVDRPAAVAAVLVLGVVGSIVFTLLPLLVGAVTDELALEADQIGWLGSADMVGMFGAALVAMLWIRRWDWRAVAAAACALLLLCHLLSTVVDAFALLLAVRVGAGFAGGSLMSIALTSLGDTRTPDRYFGLFISGQLALGALGLWLLPAFIAERGAGAIFLALAAATAAAAVAVPLLPRGGRVPALPEVGGGRTPLSGVLALVACFVFNAGIMAVWAYMERIGNAAGLAPSFIGGALATSLLAGLLGTMLVSVVGDRYGRTLPLAATVGLQVLALVLLVGEPSAVGFAIGVMLFSFCWNFPVPYQLGITVAVDGSGRLVVLFLSAVKLGYAVGPLLSARLLSSADGYQAALLLGGACFLVSGAIYLPLAVLAKAGAGDVATEPAASGR